MFSAGFTSEVLPYQEKLFLYNIMRYSSGIDEKPLSSAYDRTRR